MSSIAQNTGEDYGEVQFLHTLPLVGSALNGAQVTSTGSAPETVDLIRIERQTVLLESWVKWISAERDWKHFLTLTYRDYITQESALAMWYRFIRLMNRRVFGGHYTRIVHHSYFSYVMGIERQARDVLHFHVLVDRPIDYSFIHKVWNDWAGFAWIEKVGTDQRDPVYYVAKYVSKGGEVLPYFTDERTARMLPPIRPPWWFDLPARAPALKA